MAAKADDEEEVEESDSEAKADSVVYGHNETGNEIEGTVSTHANSTFGEYVKRKSQDLTSLDLSDENLAKAYAQFKAEQEEARTYEVIKNEFENRYQSELKVEADAVTKANYDAGAEVESLKAEFADLRKSLESNNDVIAKQVESVQQQAQVPEELVIKMQNLHELTWDEVEELRRNIQQ